MQKFHLRWQEGVGLDHAPNWSPFPSSSQVVVDCPTKE